MFWFLRETHISKERHDIKEKCMTVQRPRTSFTDTESYTLLPGDTRFVPSFSQIMSFCLVEFSQQRIEAFIDKLFSTHSEQRVDGKM